MGLTITRPRAPRLKTCAAHHAASYSLLFTHTEPPPLSEDSAEAVCRYASVGWQSLAFRPCALSHSTPAAIVSLLNYSDRTRPPWPQRRTLLSTQYHYLTCFIHATQCAAHNPSHPNCRYPFPALTRRQTTRLRALPPTRSFPSTSGRSASTALNPWDTYPLTPARACSADTTIARIRQTPNCAIPTTQNRVFGIAVNPIPRFRSFLT